MNSLSAPRDARVCVIIAAYNAATTIGRAVRSALAEPEVLEVIVVNDASHDQTAEIASMADDGSGRLKIINLPQNAGPSASRNRAINESHSPWISVLDADDFFLPGRMARLLKHADRADLIADDAGQTPEGHLDGPFKSLIANYIKAPTLISLEEFVLSNVSKRNRERAELGFLKPILRRSFLNEHSIRYQEQMRLGEDYELYTRMMALGGRFIVVPDHGYVSVVRNNSLSGRHREVDLLQLRQCDIELAKINGITTKQKSALRKHYLNTDCKLQWRLLINAVKERNLHGAAQTFIRPWPVPFFLLIKLVEQLVYRTKIKVISYAQ